MTDFIIFILDKANQFFCSHKNWKTSYELDRKKVEMYGDYFTCSPSTMITREVHCNKCGKKWIENTFE